jgi:glycine cleavage system T protein
MAGDSAEEGYFKMTARFSRLYTPEDMELAANYAIAEAIYSGITCISDYNHNARSPEFVKASFDSMTNMGIRGHVSYGTYRDMPGSTPTDFKGINELKQLINLNSKYKDISLGLGSRSANYQNIEKDWEWIKSLNTMGAGMENRSDHMALLALQGPESLNILQSLTETEVSEIGFYNFKTGTVAGQKNVIISATGYTGEKGFELYIDTEKSDPLVIWDRLFENGRDYGLEPAGLGARDTLRLEMGYALYGNDITKDTTPLEARMGWLTKLEKEDFVGKSALMKQKEQGVSRKLMGFEVEEPRNVPRSGYEISNETEQVIGFVTSGTQSISLDKGIGMGYISSEKAVEGEKIYIQIRKKRVPAVVVKPPFLKK